MKLAGLRSFIASFLLVAPLAVQGQGTLYFANRAAPIGLDAPVYEVASTDKASPFGLLAALLVGASPDALSPFSTPVGFLNAGYWTGEVYSIPGLAPASTAYVQVQVWSTATGASYASVVTANGRHGVSEIFPVVLGGDTRNGTQPPSFPAYLAGLKPITLVGVDVPEPGPTAFLALGGLLLAALRRRGRTHAGASLVGLVLLLAGLLAPRAAIARTNTLAGWILLPDRQDGGTPWILDTDGQTPLQSRFDQDLYVASVWIGPSPLELQPTLNPIFLGADADAGFPLFRIPIQTTGFAPDQRCWAQVRVWMARRGMSWDAALASGSAWGISKTLEVVPGTALQPGVISALEPFALVRPTYASIRFENLVPGLLDAPVLSVDGTTPLAGPTHVAQLFARLRGLGFAELEPVGPPVPFGTGNRAGYWEPDPTPALLLTNMAAGQIADVQIFAWRAADGTHFAQAARAGGVIGSSGPLIVPTPADGSPALLSDLRSFRVQPAPVGTVDFRNLVPGELDARVGYSIPPDPAPMPLPPTTVAQLWVALSLDDPSSFTPVGSPSRLGKGARAGYWPELPGPAVLPVPGFRAGELVWAKVRLWDTAFGDSYDQAQFAGGAGEFGVFRLRLGGDDFAPAPTLPPSLQFNLVASTPRGVYLDFRNRVPGRVDNPVLGRDGQPLSDPNFVAQLYVEDLRQWPVAMVPLGDPAPFGTGDQAGYWQPGADPFPAILVEVGCCATVQVRIWDRSLGATFEQAAAGPRLVSRTMMFFASADRQYLDPLGFLTLQPFREPAALVRHLNGPLVWDSLAGGRPLDLPGFVAQCFVTTNVYNAAFLQGAGGTPVGPIHAIGTGTQAGVWQAPARLLVELADAIPVGAPFQLQARAWDSSLGATYAEAIAAGSRIGFSESFEMFTALPRDQGPPPEIYLPNFALGGARTFVNAPPGLHLVAHPFAQDAPLANTPETLMERPPNGTTLFLFDPALQTYRILAFHDSWDHYRAPIRPGEAFFIHVPGTQTIPLFFSGTPGPLPALVRPERTVAFVSRGNTLGRQASFTELTGLPARDGDLLFRFVDGAWTVNEFAFGDWAGGAPVLAPREAVFLRLAPRAP